MSLPFDTIEIESAGEINASILWLHGLGADGHDFAPVVKQLGLPGIRYLLPHAPYRPISLNNGYEMRGWYDLFGLQPGSPQDEAGIRATEQGLRHLIEQELARGIPARRILLAGFSQGGAIALHTATRFPLALGGVLALSTYLPLHELLPADAHTANTALPIFMAHGTGDAVIALATAERSRDLLETQGYPVEWHTYPMAHSVCLEELEDIRRFLQQRLAGNVSQNG